MGRASRHRRGDPRPHRGARARRYKEVRTRRRRNDTLLDLARSKFGIATPFGGPTSSGMLTLHCPPDAIHRLAMFLREHGAQSVIVADIEYVFTRDNPLFAKLEAAVRPR
jgi:ATP phosphoribosyltransferase